MGGRAITDIALKLGNAALADPEDPPLKHGLDLPFYIVEHKQTAGEYVVTGANRHRMYSTASVKFLAALGITDFPVFSLVTEGCIGVVTCTWLERDRDELECTYIAERDARAFDISTPIGAFHYATFLCMVATRHALALKEELEKKKEDFYCRFGEGHESTRWTMTDQVNALKTKSPQAQTAASTT